MLICERQMPDLVDRTKKTYCLNLINVTNFTNYISDCLVSDHLKLQPLLTQSLNSSQLHLTSILHDFSSRVLKTEQFQIDRIE